MTKNELYAAIEKIRMKLIADGVDLTKGLSELTRVYKNIDLKYVSFSTYQLRGIVAIARNLSENHVILINDKLSERERFFHGVHEFIHTQLHNNLDSPIIQCYTDINLHRSHYIEWQANEGAAELILPYTDFIPLFVRYYSMYLSKPQKWSKSFGYRSLYDVLSDKYNVTGQAVKNRISSLSYEIDQYACGVRIENINLLSRCKQVGFGINATNYVDSIEKASAKYDFTFAWDDIIV